MIPEGVACVGISPKGRFAILKSEDWRMRPLRLVHIETGHSRLLDVPIASSFIIDEQYEWEHYFPWISRLSSYEGCFLTRSFIISEDRYRTYLYRVPDDMLER